MNAFKTILCAAFLALPFTNTGAEPNALMELCGRGTAPKTDSLQSYYAVGEITLGGIPGTAEMYYKHPGRYRMMVNLSILSITQVFDGERAWMIDQNNQMMELTGHEKAKIINSAYMAGFSFMRNDGLPGKVNFVRDTVIGDSAYKIYRVLPNGGDSLWIFCNTVSARIEILQERLDEIGITTYQSDFRDVEGFEIPFASKIVSPIPALNSTITFTEFNVNPVLPDSLFVMGGGDLVDYRFPDNEDSVVVPMNYHNGHIYFRAAVDGDSSRYFILDSGAGLNILNKSYADEIGIEARGGFAAKGVSGYGEASIGQIDSVNIGEITLFDQTVAVTGFDEMLHDIEGNSLGGILGYDILSRMPVRIDYGGQRLIFYNPRTFITPGAYHELKFDYFMKIPLIECGFVGIPGKFLLDLGNAYSIILHNSFIDKNDIQDSLLNVEDSDFAIGGIGGLTKVSKAAVREFRIAGMSIADQGIWIAEGESGISGSNEIDGNIGNRFLEKFSIIMDYKSKKIYIKAL